MPKNTNLYTHIIHVMITYMLDQFLACVINIRNEQYINAFGENLKKLRLQRKLSRETLAAYANIETMQVYRIETGKVNTTISTLYALAKALEIHPKKLLDFENS
jgi:DNA-binding Xre family transcriptional regulator